MGKTGLDADGVHQDEAPPCNRRRGILFIAGGNTFDCLVAAGGSGHEVQAFVFYGDLYGRDCPIETPFTPLVKLILLLDVKLLRQEDEVDHLFVLIDTGLWFGPGGRDGFGMWAVPADY